MLYFLCIYVEDALITITSILFVTSIILSYTPIFNGSAAALVPSSGHHHPLPITLVLKNIQFRQQALSIHDIAPGRLRLGIGHSECPLFPLFQANNTARAVVGYLLMLGRLLVH